MEWYDAVLDDCPLLAEFNRQLIQDEGARNPMTLNQLEDRMRRWISSGEYRAVLFRDGGEPVAYALFRETDDEIYLRHFFVVRHRRREGLGRKAMEALFHRIWNPNKRWTVSVLVDNARGLAFWRAIGFKDHTLILEILPRTAG